MSNLCSCLWKYSGGVPSGSKAEQQSDYQTKGNCVDLAEDLAITALIGFAIAILVRIPPHQHVPSDSSKPSFPSSFLPLLSLAHPPHPLPPCPPCSSLTGCCRAPCGAWADRHIGDHRLHHLLLRRPLLLLLPQVRRRRRTAPPN